MRLNESNTVEQVDVSDISLDYDALQYDVKTSKPQLTLYFDKTGIISDVDSVEMTVLASSALPSKVYVGIEYDPVEYNTKFSLDTLTDDIYEIEETESGYSMTTDNIDGLVNLGFTATFDREIIWPFPLESVHDQLAKTMDRIKTFEGKVIYYVTGQILGSATRKNPIPGIELSDGFKAVQREYLKDAGKKQAIQKVRQGRSDFDMLIDSIKKYPNVKSVDTNLKRAGKDFTTQTRIVAIVNKWNPKLKKRIPERMVIDMLSNTKGNHFLARILGQVFNGHETRSWEQMDKWLKNTLQVQHASEEEVSDDWGTDMDAAEEAALGIRESGRFGKKKGMNLYEAVQILKKKGLKLIEIR